MLLVSGTVPSPLCSLAHDSGGRPSHACSLRARMCVCMRVAAGAFPTRSSASWHRGAMPAAGAWEPGPGTAARGAPGTAWQAGACTGRDRLGTCTGAPGLCPVSWHAAVPAAPDAFTTQPLQRLGWRGRPATRRRWRCFALVPSRARVGLPGGAGGWCRCRPAAVPHGSTGKQERV